MRAGMLVLGVALGILWIAGLSAGVVGWLVWLDFIGAILAIVAGIVPQGSVTKASPFALGVGLLVLWLIGLGTGATLWMVWWTFAFGIAFLVLGAALARGPTGIGRPSHA